MDHLSKKARELINYTAKQWLITRVYRNKLVFQGQEGKLIELKEWLKTNNHEILYSSDTTVIVRLPPHEHLE